MIIAALFIVELKSTGIEETVECLLLNIRIYLYRDIIYFKESLLFLPTGGLY